MCSHTCNSQLLRRNCLAFILQFPSLYSGGTGTNTCTILSVTVVLLEIVALYDLHFSSQEVQWGLRMF